MRDMTAIITCQTCGKPVRFHLPFGGPLPEREWYCNEHGPGIQFDVDRIPPWKTYQQNQTANLLKCVRRA